MTNHLSLESSPYLLQHAENPVDWYPWGPEALDKARKEDKPIFLSIGYAACHWCHVMAHESFEDDQVAAIMNQYFVNIKVDREERPDLDGIYMNAVVAMTGSGGWPMSVFLIPDGTPFFGGTYFPPVRRYNMPAFREVLLTIARLWQEERTELLSSAVNLKEHLDRASSSPGHLQPLDGDTADIAEQKLIDSYDWQFGGWGRAPKFPQPMAIEFLLRRSLLGHPEALKVATHALDAMQRGGVYDVLGGGFARYSTDDHWLVPHFEKMLYDNAQLALVYLYGYMLTGYTRYRDTCEATLDFLLREMSIEVDWQGAKHIGFYSSLDADSEGEEGKYYVWGLGEIHETIQNPEDTEIFIAAYEITKTGNFDGKSVLQRVLSNGELAQKLTLPLDQIQNAIERSHRLLFARRQQRIRPATDDKVLVSWNALALMAFAEAGRYLRRPDYLNVARANANFLITRLMSDGRLQRSWRNGHARHLAYLEDYAGLSLALLYLYRADPGNQRWYKNAKQIAEIFVAHCSDPEWGFFDTRDDHEELLTRPKDTQDNATPAGNSMAALALLELGALSGDQELVEIIDRMLQGVQSHAVRYPIGFSKWLCAFDTRFQGITELAIVGDLHFDAMQELLAVPLSTYLPRLILAASPLPLDPDAPELLQGRPMIDGRPTAYVCKQFVCKQPVTSPSDLAIQINLSNPKTDQGA